MISEDVAYRVGPKALAIMVISKLKYPAYGIVIMTAITLTLFFAHDGLASWFSGASPFLQEAARILYLIEQYGWVFAGLLIVCFGLTAFPEYMGLSFRLGEQAFFVRSGILTHSEITIPYRHIQTITIVEHAGASLFGVCSLVVATSGQGTVSTDRNQEILLPYVHTSLARALQNELLQRISS
jgi:uncharacterized membrane protein YdbT with pleckstrin-like domain